MSLSFSKFVIPCKSKGWISATETKAYFLKDPILDFLKRNRGLNFSGKSFSSYIMSEGNKFEEMIVEILRKKFGFANVVTVLNHVSELYDVKSYERAEFLIRQKIPILHSVPLQYRKDKTFGIADLIVRGDILEKMTKTSTNLISECYYVVDIKYTTLNLKSDGIFVLNSNLFPCYKAQLLVYQNALNELQERKPKEAFLLGKRAQYRQKGQLFSFNDCFDLLGKVDFKTEDKDIVKNFHKALKWIHLVNSPKAEQWNFETYPLPHTNLYPNMSNRYDYPFHEIKKKIAEKHGDMTLITGVGSVRRKRALDGKIYSWKDKNCNSSSLGFVHKNIDCVLKANRENKIVPSQMNLEPWMNLNKKEIFIDFETWNTSLFPLKNVKTDFNSENFIYLIGICDYQGNYHSFSAKTLDSKGEKQMLDEFQNYLLEKKLNSGIFYHWSQAEPRLWKKACEKYDINLNLKWYDLIEIFKQNRIGIPGCLTYSLKDVSKALYFLKKISHTWETEMDGKSSMLNVLKILNDYPKNFDEHPEFSKLKIYNRTDVLVLWDILNFLRREYAPVKCLRKRQKI